MRLAIGASADAFPPCREEGPAEFLHVSLDQGQCFYRIRILPEGSKDTLLFVNNIMVEPDGAATIAHVAATQYIQSLVRSVASLASRHHPSRVSLGPATRRWPLWSLDRSHVVGSAAAAHAVAKRFRGNRALVT